MEKTMFTSRTAEVRNLVTEFMGQVQTEVERKDIVGYVQAHVENEVTDGVIAGAIKMMTADGEIVPVRRGVYVKGAGKAKATTFEKIYNVCRKFQIDLDRVCTFNMLELTEAEKSVYPQVLDLSERLRDGVRNTANALATLVELIQEREEKASINIPVAYIEQSPVEPVETGLEGSTGFQSDTGLPETNMESLSVESVPLAEEPGALVEVGDNTSEEPEELVVEEESSSGEPGELVVAGNSASEEPEELVEVEDSSSEMEADALVEKTPAKRRGRRAKKN